MGLAGLVAFAIISTAVVWLQRDHVHKQAADEARLNVAAMQTALGAAVWSLDRDAISLMLKPLVQQGSIVRTRLTAENLVPLDLRREGLVADQANLAAPAGAGLAPSFSVALLAPGRAEALGELQVFESYGQLDTLAGGQLPALLAVEALKVAGMAALVLWLMNRLLTRPLRQLARDVEHLPLDQSPPRLVLDRPAQVRSDELDQLVLSILRLHERQVSELALRTQAEARERQLAYERTLILASVGDAVLAFDRRGQPLYANRAAAVTLGLIEGDLPAGLRRNAGERRDFWRDQFRELRLLCKSRQEAVTRHLVSTLQRDGQAPLPFEINMTALPSGPLGYVVTLRDTSAQQRAEQADNEARVARAADRAKSEFLSRMSHELRTPLNAVLGFSDVMLADTKTPLNAAHRQLMGHVQDLGQHLLRLISDLLHLSRIEAGTMSITLQAVDAAALLASCVQIMASAAREQGVALSVELYGCAGALVQADETRLRQVLTNLLSNAIKYNRPGGAVIVSLQVDPAAGERLALTVADTGLGMSPQQLQQLFTPFNRLGREATVVPGTGLGLVIARHLMTLMGGTLSCTSQAGQGSSFLLSLPLAERGESAAAQPDSDPLQAAAVGAVAHTQAPERRDVRGSLLVVEDEEVNSLLLTLYLQYRPNVQVRVAASVDEALVLLALSRPDMALIDMNLGDRSGHEVLAAARADTGAAPVHCVAFSADAMPEQVLAARVAGFDDYWIKPMGLQEFLARLDRVF